MKKIGVVGHFGGTEAFFDGQTVKTKNLEAMLVENGLETYRVDTYYFKKNPIFLLLKTLKCLFTCKNIVILLSVNGMNFYLPFLHYVNKIFHRNIFHDIIGSELLEMVKNKPRLVKYLNSLNANWFEYGSGVEFLKAQGVNNALVLPNCKNLEPVSLQEIDNYEVELPFKFCTFSRVMPEKGITEAIEVIAEINREHKTIIAQVDIYGPVEESYKTEFEALLVENKDIAKYCGLVDSSKSVKVLKNYYALLFPTRWAGEGFPGTILDALASGLPIIASDWNANKELIKDGQTGIVYPNKEIKDLKDAIKWAISNNEKMQNMRVRCRNDYDNYTPETISKRIISEFVD